MVSCAMDGESDVEGVLSAEVEAVVEAVEEEMRSARAH